VREEFAPFAGFGHVVDKLSAQALVGGSVVLFIEDAIFVFLHAVAAEEVFTVVAVVAIIKEGASEACVAADHEFCFVGCVGFVVAFEAPCGFVCVAAIFCAQDVVAITDVFAVYDVVALMHVFGACYVVAGAVFGFCYKGGFVGCFVFV